ncbi:ABC transporter permease [Arsenicicoccus sp. oral taxon 190]|uniref:ABC transporter permease n=1 Tax=Arsenicicoccus sp. oral taxon 190 TaxID=1658671 RepID=UPI00067A226C|nr:ABC transporter permease [Arsenicicoccus sp. oral taxon 190]AKT50559.1 ABC transporter permease [Arsenicicoccus sp. oral taxon 190]
MTWLQDNWSDVLVLVRQHVWLAGLPLVVGLLVALPLGWLATRFGWLRQPLVIGSGLLYTIPSLALFILMPLLIGTQILDPTNVVVAMTLYTVALLVRTVVDGLGSVPDDVRQAATAMGIGRVRRLLTVELPLAVPVIASGLRVAAVSNVSIVSVAALIGVPQLGTLFTDGFSTAFMDPIVVGIVACVLLAFLFDLVINLFARALTPWRRGTGAPA